MKNYGKWIGGGLGFVLGGPIGAILGFAVGSMLDTSSGTTVFNPGQRRVYNTTPNDFVVSLLVLSAAIMKSDGKVMKSELDFVLQFLTRQFGAQKAKEQIVLLREILEKPIPLRDVCEQIRTNMQHPLRLQLMHYLFGLAAADLTLDGREVKTLEEIARYLGINHKDYESIRAMFGADTESSYKILEIEENASEAEIKKAYRKMATKYHPDKVTNLGPEFEKAAREKFVKVQEAYETIKKQRNIK